MIKYFFIPFVPSADIDYLFLLELYKIADFQEETKTYSIINYGSVRRLSARLQRSESYLNSRLSNTGYYPFFTVDKQAKNIRLHNDIKGKNTPFVRLCYEETELLKTQDNLFCRYYIYLKYHTAKAPSDFTQEQFLSAIGYSNTSVNKEKLRSYNTLLQDKGILQIVPHRDINGRKRNYYSLSFSLSANSKAL